MCNLHKPSFLRNALSLGYDLKNHMTLNGVPVGVPLDDVMPACQGDPKAAKTLCHGPVRGPHTSVDVYGFWEGEASDGKPLVTSMWASMNSEGTLIRLVGVRLAPSAALPVLFALRDGLGMPSSMDLWSVQWQTRDNNVFLMSGSDLPTLAIATKN
ncbi:TPA: hypothetical protein QDB15_000038 [Burkholderia vietnamiensis]|uniref:Uncharacterized protein n=1 Tax=Pandoraea apista TaxID=93218 RepID=A0A5E5P1G9_9BURK|nr:MULTISPECIES: hypothetical protein [Burkholderiaceae]MCA8206312.1 hypothetical protein [Burkholderia vietnamiensis]VVG70418.1 hypothetical protein PAP18089_01378 [Pandoraea apista]HDR8943110.1 hypothetical protein [Burkholderia vietnamiensis]HDR9116314.1 hypothetical protein [Burkholderia vietnamiensis]HDR9205360.1 hypothetical protein [Burkholderia vietnamiensis]